MKISQLTFAGAAALVLTLLGGCAIPGSNPNPVAYKPHNQANVRVKVSLSKQQVYVMEGNRPLLVAATCVGAANKGRTPAGAYTVLSKQANRRSNTYGFYRSGGTYRAAEVGHGSGTYIGHPMPYWVEFKSGYGFHQGDVWPIPHSYGCLRLHKNVAAKFFALVREGTPVSIAQTQPEDLTIGHDVPRPVDYDDPEPDPSILCNDRLAFPPPPSPLLIEQ